MVRAGGAPGSASLIRGAPRVPRHALARVRHGRQLLGRKRMHDHLRPARIVVGRHAEAGEAVSRGPMIGPLSDLLLGLLCAFTASVMFDVGVATQALEARATDAHEALRPSLLAGLVRRRRW